METGFLNPIHDEEHFTSTFYSQTNSHLEDPDHVLFPEMIVPEIIDYDNLWPSVDDLRAPTQSEETGSRKEDFQKMLFEWQNQLTSMQETDTIKQIVPVAATTTREVRKMFEDTAAELFPYSHPPPIYPNLEDLTEEERLALPEIIDVEVSCITNEYSEGNIYSPPYQYSPQKEVAAKSVAKTPAYQLKQTSPRNAVANLEKVVQLKNQSSTEKVVGIVEKTVQQRKLVETLTKITNVVKVEPRENAADAEISEIAVANLVKSAHQQYAEEPRKSQTNVTFEDSIEEQNRTVQQEYVKMQMENRLKSGKAEAEPAEAQQTKFEIKLEQPTTIGGEPMLLAGDLTSLLEQFEATTEETLSPPSPSPEPISPPSPSRPSSQTIRDALPTEVINRIKANRDNLKKIAVIPAMPHKRVRSTRMQDAGAALSRNKLLKLALYTGGPGGESVQLDHDYCTSGESTASNSSGGGSRSFYASDSSECTSQSSTPGLRAPDTGSRKDSGLESGENSDDDAPLPLLPQVAKPTKSKLVLKSVPGKRGLHVVKENGLMIGGPPVKSIVPMVSLLKKNHMRVDKEEEQAEAEAEEKEAETEEKEAETEEKEMEAEAEAEEKLPLTFSSGGTQVDMDAETSSKKKKKLNLEEYRVRREERERRSQESSRANSPASCATPPPAQPDSTTTNGQEGVAKEKPTMHSVEVQTQTFDFVDLTAKSPDPEKSRNGRKDKRNDLKQKNYRSRRYSSSSSSSCESDRHRSRRRRKSRRSVRVVQFCFPFAY